MVYMDYINNDSMVNGFVSDGNLEQMHLKAGWIV